MKKVTLEFSSEEYSKFESAAMHFKDLGLPMSPDSIVQFALKNIKEKSTKQLVDEANKSIKALLSAPKAKKQSSDKEEDSE